MNLDTDTRKVALCLVGVETFLKMLPDEFFRGKPYALPKAVEAQKLVKEARDLILRGEEEEFRTYALRMLGTCKFAIVPKTAKGKADSDLYVLDRADFDWLFEKGVGVECAYCDKNIGQQKMCKTRKALERCGYNREGITGNACQFKGAL